mmetsp:Transcript_27538/g.76944  ORF Transcript_27538/g.76944 Transcript_27538/m.76944 type:complete len:117 (+) Transcript_27538:89-439(+)|eukprot:CAMPEP_0119134730 /NCGR_PEP_ID=MMETSP1310-20130426/17688_1 /TAXON_ID=464262 /ORGANISM="Genus nov. species nov., Strain RCC2339" /LENGTH=116 /DNA_ID=CAMNT_0007125555 /DNA_START=39 /DNA_END=389 /DNA_ORIENTATION=-
MNDIASHELFLLPPGVEKVSFERDTKIPFAGTFTIEKEDHTLGNMLRHQLLRNPDVIFAGYMMPHPLEHKIVIKVQTTRKSTPNQAMQTAIKELQKDLGSLQADFEEGIRRAKELR